MRRIAFIISIMGIFILLLFLNSKGVEVQALKDLYGLEVNQKVRIFGEVSLEKDLDDYSLLTINDIILTCECDRSYLGEKVDVLGIVSEYEGRKQIKVLRINMES